MTLVVYTDIVTTDPSDNAIDDGAQPIYIAPGALVAAEGNGALGIYSVAYIDLTIGGDVFGYSGGIYAQEGANVIRMLASSSVTSPNTAIEMIGSAAIRNAGFIAGTIGIDLSMTALNSSLINSGTIMASTGLSYSSGNPALTATIRNSGTISGTSNALDMGSEIDIVTNTGTIQGDVRLGSGNDRFESQAGVMDGVVYGGSGDDILKGSAYDDILNGGSGADELYGGAGLDTASYTVSNSMIYVDMQNSALNTGDAAGDLFFSIENVEGGNRADQIFGNSSANILSGGAANDRLDGRSGNDMLNGGAGDDRMTGGLGDDIFYVDSVNDLLFELANEGTDEVRSTVSYSLRDQYIERLTLLGADSIEGHGNAFDNVIVGNDAGNVIEGRLGKDILTGKGGADQFLMTGAPGAANLDRITDFEIGIDKIAIDRSYYAAVGPIGTLPNYAFGSAASPDASDRILYNSANGVISYDADGSGPIAALPFAQVTAGLALSASDFLVVV